MADYNPEIEDDDAADGEAPDANEALHREALERFDQIISFSQEERALCLRDRRFATIAGAQWEGDWADQFANSIMVEVNKTAAGVEKVISDYRRNRFTVNYRAADDGGDPDTAELLNGMFRADVAACAGQEAFDTAFEEGVQGGMGAFALSNDWEDEYDPDNDYQRICFDPIPDADQSVFWDPNAKRYDKADAKYCFVLTAVAKETYTEEYDDDPASWPSGIFKTYYDWYTPDIVRIAKYYEVREDEGVLRIYRNKATGEEQRFWAKDLTAQEVRDLQVEGWEEARSRMGKRRTVWVSTLSGGGILKEPKRIAGGHIPVIPFYGKRWFIDNMERCRGEVRFAVDPQRIRNAMYSKLTETAALSPIEVPIFYPEQVLGHADSWSRMHMERHPFELINPVIGPDGNIVVAGPIGKVEAPQLPPALVALLQFASQDIADLTNSQDGADEVKANVSAEAMDLAATRVDSKAEIYIDNWQRTMTRCGEVYYAMATDIYVEEGRKVETMSADGKEYSYSTLLEAYADETGFRIRHDLSKGKYKVIADVSEATKTRRDKTVRTLVNVAQIAAPFDPDLAGVCLSTAMVNMDGEGMEDLQGFIRAKLVTEGAVKPTEEEKAQLAQAAQQKQQLSADEVLAQATARKESALADKATADAGLSKAKTVESLANAAHTHVLTSHEAAVAHHASASSHLDNLGKFKALMEPAPLPKPLP